MKPKALEGYFDLILLNWNGTEGSVGGRKGKAKFIMAHRA